MTVTVEVDAKPKKEQNFCSRTDGNEKDELPRKAQEPTPATNGESLPKP